MWDGRGENVWKGGKVRGRGVKEGRDRSEELHSETLWP